DDNYLPLRITGGPLNAIEFTPPVASAQIKSAVLFAGLHARGTTRVHEPVPSRNHTEIALAEFGARIRSSGSTIEGDGGHSLHGNEFPVPGDMSSAAFFIVAALTVPNSKLKLANVGLNPTRTGLIRLLKDAQGKISAIPGPAAGGEPIGDIVVETSDVSVLEIAGPLIPNVIDEIPVLAVLGTRTDLGVR